MKGPVCLTNGKDTVLFHALNPICTWRGQSWPRQLRCQIPDKILMYLIPNKIYPCVNVFQIFVNFWLVLKKSHFDVIFFVFSSEFLLRRRPADPPFCLVLMLLQTTRGWEKSHQAVVCSPVQRQSIPVSFLPLISAECRGGGFSVGPALLLFLSVLMLPHCSGQISETRALYFTPAK
jgi:hypothetical protein